MELCLAPDDHDVLLLKSTAENKLQEQKERHKEKELRGQEKRTAKRAKLFFLAPPTVEQMMATNVRSSALLSVWFVRTCQ